MMFNLNDSVRVKLTDNGRAALRKNHDALYSFAKENLRPKYSAPKEDENGWSTWQLWRLMQELGPHISMGCHPPFETTIEIIEPHALQNGKGGA